MNNDLVYKVYEIDQSLDAQIETNDPVHKYAVCLRKSGKAVGHLKKGATGRFAKTISFFLKGNSYSETKTTRHRFELGDGEGLQVPSKLKLVSQRDFIDLLQDKLIKLKERVRVKQIEMDFSS